MDHATFWKLIDQSRKKSKGILEDQLEFLKDSLTQLEPDDIVAFDRIFREYMQKAYTWDLWGAAYVIGGGCGQDGFEFFRGWLISKGQKAYEDALRDPEALLAIHDEDDGDGQFEGFGSLAGQAWEEKTGQGMEDFPAVQMTAQEKPAGESWSEDSEELEERFPKLWEKFS